MKKNIIFITVLMLAISVLFCSCKSANSVQTTETQATGTAVTTQTVSTTGAPAAATTTEIPKTTLTAETTTAKIEPLVYKNIFYGFNFTLPASWKGFSIVEDAWQGTALSGPLSGTVTETGVIVNIRHPKWSSANKRQDIPLMVFTLKQWDALQKGDIGVSAAPVLPTELGRNSAFVIALPARYNFSGLPGYQEVESILNSKPIQMTENIVI